MTGYIELIAVLSTIGAGVCLGVYHISLYRELRIRGKETEG